ncbi:MAG: serpin family protein [Cyclobacteriaceae bacterium]
MRKRIFPLILAALSLLTACSDENIGSMNNAPNLRELSVPEQELVQTSNNFAFDIFRQVEALSEDKNIFISPLSISMALHMTANGATAETKEEMKAVLGVSQLSDAEANQAVEDLTDLLLSMDRKVALSIANSIWFTNSLTLEDEFAQLIEKHYNGRIEGLDFGNTEAVRNTINGWVEQKTNGKIKNLLEGISPDAVMYLINAIYFKADWQYKFDKDKTKAEAFYPEAGSSVQVPTMFSAGIKFRSYHHNKFRLVELPYGNGQFKMSILLPHPGFTTDDVLAELDAESFSQWSSQADTMNTEFYMPRFKSEFKTELKPSLMALGMERPFGPGADFSHFFQEDIGSALQISKVIHQSFIEVNESGTEAAAATAVEIGRTSAGPKDPPVVRIDRSFIYLIHEKQSGAILFAGKMLNPQE